MAKGTRPPPEWMRLVLGKAAQFDALSPLAQAAFKQLVPLTHHPDSIIPYGHFASADGKPLGAHALASHMGQDPAEVLKALRALTVAGFLAKDKESGRVFLPGMVRYEEIRSKRAAGGAAGAAHGVMGKAFGSEGGDFGHLGAAFGSMGGEKGREHGVKGAKDGVKGGRPKTPPAPLQITPPPPLRETPPPPLREPPAPPFAPNSKFVDIAQDIASEKPPPPPLKGGAGGYGKTPPSPLEGGGGGLSPGLVDPGYEREPINGHVRLAGERDLNRLADPDLEEDPVKALFDHGVLILTRAGETERKARTIIGKLRQAHTDEEAMAVIVRAANKTDPVAAIMAAVRRKRPPDDDPYDHASQPVESKI